MKNKTQETIFQFLDELQEKYKMNNFSPADIHLWKNGNTLYATVKVGNSEIILERWSLEKFKNAPIV